MTSDELRAAAERLRLLKSCSSMAAVYPPSKYYSPMVGIDEDRRIIADAYLASVLADADRIAELERENAELKELVNSIGTSLLKLEKHVPFIKALMDDGRKLAKPTQDLFENVPGIVQYERTNA